MAEPINIPIRITADDVQGIATIKAHLRELGTLGKQQYTQALNELTQQWNAARQRLGVEAVTGSTAVPGVGLQGLRAIPGAASMGGSISQDVPGGFWRRVRPGGAIRPVEVGPVHGPWPEPATSGYLAPRRGPLYGPGFGPRDFVGYQFDIREAQSQQREAERAAVQMQRLQAQQFGQEEGERSARERRQQQTEQAAIRMQRLQAQQFGQEERTRLDVRRQQRQADEAAMRMQRLQAQEAERDHRAAVEAMRRRQPELSRQSLRELADVYFPGPPAHEVAAQQAASLIGNQAMFGRAPESRWMRMLSATEGGIAGAIGALPRGYMAAAGGIESGVAGVLRGGVGLAGGLARAAYGAVHRPAGLALGAVAGIGIYQTLTESMELYRQRAQGVIDIGMRTNRNFQQTRDTIEALRNSYQVLTHDSLAAMDAMSRVTGRYTAATVHQAVGFGLAHGLEPSQAAGVAGALSMLGVGSDPLARAFAGARAGFRTGNLPMRGDVLADEITRVAGIGGTAAFPMGIGFYGSMTGMIAGMGERYRMPGAAAGFAERLTAGATEAPDAGVRMLRFRALENLRREREAAGLGSKIWLGEGPERMQVDLGTYLGQALAMENPTANPAILQAYARQNERIFGFDPTLSALMYPRLVGGGQMNVTEGLRLRQRVASGGGFDRILGANPNVAGETALAQANLAARQQQPEFDVQRVQAAMEGRLEELGKSLVGVSNDLKTAMLRLSGDFQEHKFSLDSLRKAMEGMDDSTKKLLAVLGMAGATGPVGFAASAAVGLAGFNTQMEDLAKTLTPGSVMSNIITAGDWLGNVVRSALGMPPLQPRR